MSASCIAAGLSAPCGSQGRTRRCIRVGRPSLPEASRGWERSAGRHRRCRPRGGGGPARVSLLTIHPFVDGNGRVARALIHVILRRRGVASRFVPPISLVLVANARSYVEGLTIFREGDLAGWTTGFAHALRDEFEFEALTPTRNGEPRRASPRRSRATTS